MKQTAHGIVLSLLLLAGCCASRPGPRALGPTTLPDAPADDDLQLHPQVIGIPLLAQNAVFGGVTAPTLLSPAELERFLALPLPAVADVAPDKSLWSVVAESTGRPLYWSRIAGAESRKPPGPVERLRYRDVNWQADPPTVRDALGVIIGEANQRSVNNPVLGDVLDVLFENYAVVGRDQILFLSLPIGRLTLPPSVKVQDAP